MKNLFSLGWIVVPAGFVMVVIGATAQDRTSSEGVVFIDPFPVVFGGGPGATELELFSLAMGGVMTALLLLWSGRGLGRR